MEKKTDLMSFNEIKEKMHGTEDPEDIVIYKNEALKLVEKSYGRRNDHYKSLLIAPDYPIETHKVIVLAELVSIIKELGGIPSREPILGTTKASNQSEMPLKAYSSGETKKISQIEATTENDNKQPKKKIFIVHGHDEKMKDTVDTVIKNFGFESIILDLKPNESLTIIEKLEKYSNVDFAVVLFSPDDFGFAKKGSVEDVKSRARQNVILELGFFIGKLGRKRVPVLKQKNCELEFPSDYRGVLYITYDEDKEWISKLATEMKDLNPKIDKNQKSITTQIL